MAARYCGGNGVAENGKAAAAVQHRHGFCLPAVACPLRFAPCTRGNATVASVHPVKVSFFSFFFFSTFPRQK